jgi:hypothetical protein
VPRPGRGEETYGLEQKIQLHDHENLLTNIFVLFDDPLVITFHVNTILPIYIIFYLYKL